MEVGHMARDLEALFRISNVINSIRDIGELQRELLRLIAEVIPAEQSAVVLLADAEAEPSSICTWHRLSSADPQIQIQRSLVRRALWEQSVVSARPASDSGRALHVLCSPLIAVEKTIGVVYLICPATGPPYGEDYSHFLGSASRIAAVTLESILALNALRSENLQLKQELKLSSRLVGESRHIQQIENFVERVAHSDSTVLIRGESGTGKEIVARSIHEHSPRADRPFIAINCAAIPDTLFESELFGYEKGAFTGATGMKKGKLEAAEDGTLFLDEIGELPPPMQAKLLRVLQQKEYERVGGTRLLPFKARVIAATNKNLEEAIQAGQFRQDLYYRLNVVSTSLLPLRERREDIPLLALFFASRYANKSRRPFKGISPEARALMMRYSWPGNVRELENAIEHAIVMGLTEDLLPEDLPIGILEEQSATLPAGRYQEVLNKTKKDLVLASLREANGSFPEAARLLGVHPKYLHRLVRNLNLKADLR
jgi:transcriptional regulator with PAS, ATPase and Fis domain